MLTTELNDISKSCSNLEDVASLERELQQSL